ncbi:MAG TPA: D-glycerate dehydrogenase [Vicinamibacterales bacterium]|nr:D-glycerate dehydrogenase [Vicinamibacterales bacterium]HPK71510.1 D-glycerate dehydrogenase [Vicinamibacterales bacterium]HPW20098.1 D-glycerate dehydrogenase [Vicinamibacterales bacterium]
MARPGVLVTCRIPTSVVERLEAACDVEVFAGPDAMPPGELKARLEGKQALLCLLTDRITADVLDAGRDLRIVANIAVGFDNIDLDAARARGVVVSNTPDVLTQATADLTWGLILAATRRIPEGERLLRRGGWSGWALDFLLGSDLRDKQLGIVGLGRIGAAVASRAAAFGMRVAYATLDEAAAGPSAADPAWARLGLDELLSSSDVVSLHVPLTPSTRHLIDRRAILRMKRRAYLINTSRGPVVDEEALAWALRERLLAGAALDVFEEEPRVHPGLLELENVVLAPHLGSATVETRTAMADLAARNVLAVLSGGPPLTPVRA